MSIGDLDEIQAIHDQGGDLTVLATTCYHGDLTWSLLTLAAWHGHTHLVAPLLDAGLSVEGGGTTNWTPLIVAARQGHAKMVKELLAHGANPLAKDSQGIFIFYMRPIGKKT